MATLDGYEDFRKIHDSENSQVYRAKRVSEGDSDLVARQPVILKFLNQEYPTPEQIRRYKQEYQLISQLGTPGIIKAYSLTQWERSYVIVLEDFGGISLKQWLKEREPLTLEEFLKFAIAMTESLGQIHAQHIIHKDINPANIVFNSETQQLKIIDFGIATQLSRETPTLKNPNVLEGTLAYISPEQTGRMNRSLDYRTDFYSLGVTFYELLTGQLPFQSEDPLELVHCHIAKTPEALNSKLKINKQQSTFNGQQSTVNPQKIPEILSDLVLKLMAKNAEDRYQSSWGLKADLEECLRQLEETGNIAPFALGQQDISDRFQIPQKLYGREQEIKTLLETYERVVETGKVELMLVAGYSGIGKSSLVEELFKPITARRGYFIAGKFDQLQRNIPYFAIVEAFRGLINQLLGESEGQLQVWREKLLQALGNNGQIIIDVIPQVELIIGPQPSVPKLEANEAQNRFNLVFNNFIQVFCSQEHPLTVFLDDLQWADTHYRIGQILLQNIPPETREENIFQLVNQLNYGTTQISEQTERDELAALNLIAGRKAKDANAYQTAKEYTQIGLFLLGEQPWERQYSISLTYHELATELAWLCGDFEQMEAFITSATTQTKSVLEQINLYQIQIFAKLSQHKLTDAITIGQQILTQLGINFPETPTEKDIQQAIADIREQIGDREITDLAYLPQMTDPAKIAIVRIANSLIPATYIAGSPLFPLVAALSVKLSIQYGNIADSAYAYANYGGLICNLLYDVETGVKFGQLALQVLHKLDAKMIKPKVLASIGVLVLHRKYDIKETLSLQQEGYGVALEIGDLEHAGFNAQIFGLHSFWGGQPLTFLEPQVRSYYHALIQYNQSVTANHSGMHLQATLNLLGATENAKIFSGEVFKESELFSRLSAANDLAGLYYFYLYKLMLCYLFEDIASARNYAIEVRKILIAGTGVIVEPIFYFYDSLSILAVLNSAIPKFSEQLQQVEENQKQLQEYWAKYAPMNHQHKVDLVEAEKCRILGQKAEAIEFYNRAIAGAKEYEYLQEEALAYELMAKFYLNWNQEKVARLYMMDAHYCYSRWGAMAKVQYLEKHYPHLCQSSTPYSYSSTLKTHSTSGSTNTEVLDLATVIKSTSAISSEIVLDKLLATLINILVENAGARRGILILRHNKSLSVEAIKESDSEQVLVSQSLPIEQFKQLATKIVYYVARTRETVVLNDAMNEGRFTDDTYIRESHCQSIACTPLLYQGRFKGMIYLENNLSVGAFTQERMTFLQTLATQAAISLENAQLYNNITTLNQAYERFIPSQFLSFLEKESIVDVKLGDQVEREMTVLFCDIRDFTTLSEQMTPAENFAFINEYLAYMEPQMQKYGGFIDKYIGDAIMALFPNSADDGVQGAIAMLEALKQYNHKRQEQNVTPLRIGIGLHTGTLMLGTVGGMGRMDGTAIGDAVNLSARVEGLTKTYGISLLITHQTFVRLNNPFTYHLRFIEQVKAKGKAKAVGLFEVFSTDYPPLRDAKMATKGTFERAVFLFHEGYLQEAARLFQDCLDYHEGDRAAQHYLKRCHPN